MRLEKRGNRLLVVLESEAESQMVDEAFGKAVDDDGLIASVKGEVRLSDGYGEHYIALSKN